VVDEAVDHGRGHDVVAENFAPSAEGFVGGDDQACAFVAAGHQLEKQVGRFRFERDVADLVDDDERVATESGEFGVDAPGVVGFGEARDPFGGGGEQDAMPGLAGPHRQPDRQVGFAGAWWAEEDDVVAGGDEVQRPQVGDGVAFESAGVVEVELFQRFARREPGGADTVLTEIFPGGWTPTIENVLQQSANAGFTLTRRQSLQPQYARTLDLWAEALEGHKNEAIAIQSEEMYERYMKYLTGCADLFRIGYIDVNQFTLAK
jgi:Mycolic acid cyclopropane synthetase